MDPQYLHYNWSYRNTIAGGGYRLRSPEARHVLAIHSNVYITNRNYPADGSVAIVELGEGNLADLKLPLAQLNDVLDGDLKLKGSYRTQYLGTRGHEIA
jgi:hypothetical protein